MSRDIGINDAVTVNPPKNAPKEFTPCSLLLTQQVSVAELRNDLVNMNWNVETRTRRQQKT
jgi:hypothetical protein